MSTTTTRREFLTLTLASYAALALGQGKVHARSAPIADAKGGKPLRILILGGTGFLGPETVEAALARGHHVTIFNRGQTQKRFPGQFEGMEDRIERLYGNRDPNLHAVQGDDNSPKGLESLAGKDWDVVIDNSGYVPRIVGASASMLAKHCRQYIFISTVSVYADNATANQNEDAPLATMADPTNEQVQQYYGALKALSEQAAEKAIPGRVTVVRPGYIVGPGDPTDRYTYWPVRISKAVGDHQEVLIPGEATDPVQMIDVRDLAEWLVRLAESNTMGTFNALGPEKRQTVGEVLAACAAAAGTSPKLTYTSGEFLNGQGISVGQLPIFMPPVGEYAGFHQWNNARAVAAGLTFRPAKDTAKAILDWWPGEIERRVKVTKDMIEQAEREGKDRPRTADPLALRAGIPLEREAEILRALRG